MFEWWSTVEPLAWLTSQFVSGARVLRDLVRPGEPASHWLERVNAHFANELNVIGVRRHEPKLLQLGVHQLSPEEERLATRYRRSLQLNDPVAVLHGTPSWNDDPMSFSFTSTDYAAVCALDKLGRRPTILSASALLYCHDTNELVLHRRSDVSRDYPRCIHTFGGAYVPPGAHGQDYDHLSLVRTVRRETMEESGIGFEISNVPTLLVGRELRVGFVHLALLGVSVSRSTLATAVSNREGAISLIRTDDLLRRLRDSDWAPPGKAQVLCWLALGAPVGRRRVRFGKYSGQELFRQFLL